MAFLLKQGEGRAVALYSRCADEVYCQAELLLLLQRTPPGAKVVGFYDVDKEFHVGLFMKAYKGRENEINQMVETVRREGFNFDETNFQGVGIMRLVPGVDQPSPTPREEAERAETLQATIEHYLPDFVKGVQNAAASSGKAKSPILVLHQDAFAAGYHKDEYLLLGMAIKYAGLHGVEVAIHGKNHETF